MGAKLRGPNDMELRAVRAFGSDSTCRLKPTDGGCQASSLGWMGAVHCISRFSLWAVSKNKFRIDHKGAALCPSKRTGLTWWAGPEPGLGLNHGLATSAAGSELHTAAHRLLVEATHLSNFCTCNGGYKHEQYCIGHVSRGDISLTNCEV